MAKVLWANSSNKDDHNYEDGNINNNSFLVYRPSRMRRCVARYVVTDALKKRVFFLS